MTLPTLNRARHSYCSRSLLLFKCRSQVSAQSKECDSASCLHHELSWSFNIKSYFFLRAAGRRINVPWLLSFITRRLTLSPTSSHNSAVSYIFYRFPLVFPSGIRISFLFSKNHSVGKTDTSLLFFFFTDNQFLFVTLFRRCNFSQLPKRPWRPYHCFYQSSGLSTLINFPQTGSVPHAARTFSHAMNIKLVPADRAT